MKKEDPKDWINPFNGLTYQEMYARKDEKEQWFVGLEDFLIKYKFEKTPLPWRMENQSYVLIQIHQWDSFGFPIYSLESKRYEQGFRGRLLSSDHASHIFWCIAEDYNLAVNKECPGLLDYKIQITDNE